MNSTRYYSPKERLAAAVADGAALLTKHDTGWRSAIDLDKLDIDDCQNCILGQLYGSYSTGLAALGLRFGCYHGFIPPAKSQVPLLTSLWKKEISGE